MTIQIVDPRVLETLAEYDSATVQNAGILARGYVDVDLDYSGPGLTRMVGGEDTVVGYAITAELTPIHAQETATDWDEYHDLIAYADGPTIAVLKDVDAPARRGAIIGDGMAYRFAALGALGSVVDGNARDVPGIRQAGLNLWASGRVPGHGPFGIVQCATTLDIHGLRIAHGDILVCDADGVTRVPVDEAEQIAEQCAMVRTKESELHEIFSRPEFTVDDYEKWKRDR